MAIFCIVAGALIGCASVPAVRGRPVTLYVAFGVLMGNAFWMAVSAVNQGALLELVPVVLLVVGAAWFLKQPRWPAALFSAILLVFFMGISVLDYRQRHIDFEYDPEYIRRGAITSLVVSALGLVYVGLGLAQSSWDEPPKRRRRRSVPPGMSRKRGNGNGNGKGDITEKRERKKGHRR